MHSFPRMRNLRKNPKVRKAYTLRENNNLVLPAGLNGNSSLAVEFERERECSEESMCL
jgi:hypothetical protein